MVWNKTIVLLNTLLICTIMACEEDQADSHAPLYREESSTTLNQSQSVVSNQVNWNASLLKHGKYGITIEYKHDYERHLDGLRQGDKLLNDRVNGIDVEQVAERAERAGASWLIWTMNNPQGFTNAPNQTLDQYLGTGLATPDRDLFLDLHEALHQRNIKLIIYVNLAAPQITRAWAEKMSWDYDAPNGGHPFIKGMATDAYADKWVKVLKEWSLRYQDKTVGYWCDAGLARLGFTEAMFAKFAAALKAGNPDAIISFNPGVDIIARHSSYSDYTAGEVSDLSLLPSSRFVDNAQWHSMLHLGHFWGANDLTHSNTALAEYVAKVVDHEGAVSINVHRVIPDNQLNQLRAIKTAVKGGKDFVGHYKFWNKLSHKSIGVVNDIPLPGARLQTKNHSAALKSRQWELVPAGVDQYYIRMKERALVFGVTATEHNEAVLLLNQTNDDQLKWRLIHTEQGFFKFQNVASGRYLALPAEVKSSNIGLVIQDESNADSQRWRLISLENPYDQ